MIVHSETVVCRARRTEIWRAGAAVFYTFLHDLSVIFYTVLQELWVIFFTFSASWHKRGLTGCERGLTGKEKSDTSFSLVSLWGASCFLQGAGLFFLQDIRGYL